MEVPEYNLEEWNSLLTLGQNVVDQQEVDKGSPLVAALAGGLPPHHGKRSAKKLTEKR